MREFKITVSQEVIREDVLTYYVTAKSEADAKHQVMFGKLPNSYIKKGKESITEKYVDKVERTRVIGAGSKFRLHLEEHEIKDDGSATEDYVVVAVSPTSVLLVCIGTGLRCTKEPVEVENIHDLSYEEEDKLSHRLNRMQLITPNN